MFANTILRRGNKCAQIVATDFGLLCSFPMKLKSEAHGALFFLLNWVPISIICNNAIEMIQGEFNIKLKEVFCHLQQTVPFTTWSTAVKREIKEMKKDPVRKMIKSRAPKKLEMIA